MSEQPERDTDREGNEGEVSETQALGEGEPGADAVPAHHSTPEESREPSV